MVCIHSFRHIVLCLKSIYTSIIWIWVWCSIRPLWGCTKVAYTYILEITVKEICITSFSSDIQTIEWKICSNSTSRHSQPYHTWWWKQLYCKMAKPTMMVSSESDYISYEKKQKWSICSHRWTVTLQHIIISLTIHRSYLGKETEIPNSPHSRSVIPHCIITRGLYVVSFISTRRTRCNDEIPQNTSAITEDAIIVLSYMSTNRITQKCHSQ